MPQSGQTSRSTSSYSSGKIPLSCQSESKQRVTYDDRYPEPRYASSPSDPRSASSSKSSSSKSGRSSKPDKIPLSISQGSSSRDEGRSKKEDVRYYPNSFLDAQPQKKPLSCQTKERDVRYYPDSAYYRR